MGAGILKNRGRKPVLPDVTEEYEQLSLPLVKGLVEDLEAVLTESFCPEPKQTAAWLLKLAQPGMSPSVLDPLMLSQKRVAVDNTTFSKRVGDLPLNIYSKALRVRMVARAKALLDEFVPDAGIIDVIADGHERNYFSLTLRRYQVGRSGTKRRQEFKEETLRRPLPRERRYWECPSHAGNKKSHACTKYLLIILTWTHLGRRLFAPVAFELFNKLNDRWENHGKAVVRAVQEVGCKVRCVLLDRWYDVKALRRFFRQHHIGHVIRLKLDAAEWDRTVYLVGEGRAAKLVELVNRLAKATHIPPKDDILTEGAQRSTVLSRAEVHDVVLDKNGPQVKLLVKAALVRDEKGGWAVDTNKSLVVLMDCTTDHELYEELYFVRWCIESVLLSLSLVQGAQRSSLIMTEYAQYTTALLTVSYGTSVRAALFKTPARLYGATPNRCSKRMLALLMQAQVNNVMAVDDLLTQAAAEADA